MESLAPIEAVEHDSMQDGLRLPEACSRYVESLPLTADERRALLADVAGHLSGVSVATAEAMAALHRALAQGEVDPDDLPRATARRRLELATAREEVARAALDTDAQGQERLVTSPPLARTSMVPPRWSRVLLGRWIGSRRSREQEGDAPDPQGTWQSSGNFRRLVLVGLTLAQTYVATNFMVAVMPYHGRQPLEVAMLVVFAILFAWVSGGFWTAMAGYVLLSLGGDRHAISRTAPADAPIEKEARVAVVMPIRNENVARVFAGLRATYESVARSGTLAHFDFFVLSDTNDADARVAEIVAWQETCRAIDAFGRLFYRWRKHRIKRKSGNIADFCRRWGKNYRYMVVLDADSIMSGSCLRRLLQLMEANPGAGIIQTAPHAAGRDTLYARMQQFANRVYGPLFTAGLHFWQLGESHYWGHNAIIRVKPFMRHCALRRLPGRGSLSGEIMSHDFVEAALMRRAGWEVWIAYDLPGSYEEMPPNLVDELQRDRRWCQGNLMNFRLFLLKGLHIAHRAVFMSGVMAYLAALLWFVFLILSTALIAVHSLSEPKYFVAPYQLFPLWPEWHPEWAITLFGATALLLLLPKILAALLAARRGVASYGGKARLAASVVGEIVLSALLAPIRMLFHTRFVVMALAGLRIQWNSPPREDAQTSWGEALRRHGAHTLLGIAWVGGVYWINPSFVWWLLPVAGALMLSIPVSVLTSRVTLGRRARNAGFFVIPEELQAPAEIEAMVLYTRQAAAPRGFVDAVVNPVMNALICAATSARVRSTATLRKQRVSNVKNALQKGPRELSGAQRMAIVDDAAALSQLHAAVWASADSNREWWATPAVAQPSGEASAQVAQPS